MAITTIDTYGRWKFSLQRDEETTTRAISIPFPTDISAEETIQAKVTEVKNYFTSTSGNRNKIIQPANWRDSDLAEEEWTTVDVSYEVVSTSTTPFAG